MSKVLGELLSEAELDGLSEKILETVDYDIYKEDLDSRYILTDIYNILTDIELESNNESD